MTDTALRAVLADPERFSKAIAPTMALRPYQVEPARAILDSVIHNRGLSFAVVFSRQSGKDEMLAQLLAQLLTLYQFAGGSSVVGLPTFTPQAVIARDRLTERLENPISRRRWRLQDGHIIRQGRASVRFLSADPGANARGNTASKLLVANEAQDILPDVWDAVFTPMGAASNATVLYMGTVWTADTLLSRQTRTLRALEDDDGLRRVFFVPWRTVAKSVPAYGQFVKNRIAELGARHPFIRTEYELEELDADGGLFPSERQAAMRGAFSARTRPEPRHDPPGSSYALTIDVAGESEDNVEGDAARRANPRKDSTAISVVRIMPASRDNHPPTYNLVARYMWTGTKYTEQERRIVQLVEAWNAAHVVIDATGAGAGLTSFLTAKLGESKVTPFVFSQASKSQLAWNFLGLIDAGRWQAFDPNADEDYTDDTQRDLDRLFWRQASRTTFSLLPGPNRLMRWSVADPTIHDDLIVSAAMTAELDRLDWRPRTARGH